MDGRKLLPPDPNEFVPDYAKRAADIVNGVITFHPWDVIKHSWIAIRLRDGGWDGTLYDSKHAAVLHQLDEKVCAYVCLRNMPGGCKPVEMKRFIDFTREAYNAGMRLPDPDLRNGGPDLLMPVSQYDWWCLENARRSHR